MQVFSATSIIILPLLVRAAAAAPLGALVVDPGRIQQGAGKHNERPCHVTQARGVATDPKAADEDDGEPSECVEHREGERVEEAARSCRGHVLEVVAQPIEHREARQLRELHERVQRRGELLLVEDCAAEAAQARAIGSSARIEHRAGRRGRRQLRHGSNEPKFAATSASWNYKMRPS